jgi:hypothetical protein
MYVFAPASPSQEPPVKHQTSTFKVVPSADEQSKLPASAFHENGTAVLAISGQRAGSN